MMRFWFLGFVVAVSVGVGGCCQRVLLRPVKDLRQFGDNFTIAIMAVSKQKKGIHRRGSWEYELTEKLAEYVQDDMMNRSRKYVDIARYYKMKIPPDLTPPQFRFVDRSEIEAILQEQDFGQTDRVDQAAAAAVGKIKGAKALLLLECSLELSGQKEEQVYDYVREEYYVTVTDPKTKKKVRKKKHRWKAVPKTIGGRRVIRVSRKVVVHCSMKLIDVATSEVIYTKVTQSEPIVVSATIREGERAKLDIRGAAVRSLRSLGHKIGRIFYPIVACGMDPRTSSEDSLADDLTWSW